MSHPVKYANIRFFTFVLRQIRLKEQCVLYEAVSERVTEIVLHEDKNHSTGVTMSDPQIMVPIEP